MYVKEKLQNDKGRISNFNQKIPLLLPTLQMFTGSMQKQIWEIHFKSFFMLFLHIISEVYLFFIGSTEKFMQ